MSNLATATTASKPKPFPVRTCTCCGSTDPEDVSGSYSSCCNELIEQSI